ncbi:hypothetical protein R5H32_16175 [Defluviimonas sp. D31]|uniref:hypothetical protein n=1 Tax=Defluviimonas sp. D31 TaxID=3083253 RepID=UPI00296EE251|nr:hypothetical protein [Defluviimonas sp. D31]MDW4550899.1 hypothetical protein [Defluviimonas sp. D31]
MKYIALVAALATAFPMFARAENVALLLFENTSSENRFAGCLNCNRHDAVSVCNRYGKYGSRYEGDSIWNRYGPHGSRYEEHSPWNRYGQGLIVVDPEGNFYGHFSLNRYAHYGQSQVELVQSLLELHEKGVELDEIRDLLCE